jgi:hypothetical protein
MSSRTRAALAAAFVLCLVAPASAAANTIVTGRSVSNGASAASSQAYFNGSSSCDGNVAVQYGTSADNLSSSHDYPLTAHAPSPEGSVEMPGLTAGTTYYYRVVLTAPCGNAEGAVRCFVHSSTIDEQENAACPNDPGEPSTGGGGGDTGGGGGGGGGGGDTGGGDTGGGGGGDTGGGGGDTSNPPPEGPKYVHPKGHHCVVPVKIGYVFRLTAQGGLKCGTIFKILDGKKARHLVGRKRVVKLPGGFRCKALNRNHGSAEYHCKRGGKGWYMRTYGAGPWKTPNPVYVDW